MKYVYRGIEIEPSVDIYHDALVYISGVNMREFYKDKVKCDEAWRIGSKKLYDYFGDILPLRNISGPPFSYGHMVCLGAKVEYPENSEPNVKPLFSGIDEGIEILKLKKNINYCEQPLFKHYYELCNYLKEKNPDQNVKFSGMESQGPLTTAILIRGQDFIYDIYDEPDKAKEFLSLLTDSIIDFNRVFNKINGIPPVDPYRRRLADDFASLIPPDMWPEFVLPYWNQFFDGLTTGEHWLHCENLSPAHLKYLKQAKIFNFQPSVSNMLTLENVKANIDIPFDWLLYSYHITEMSDEQIQEWVDNTVEAGVTLIRTQLGEYTCKTGKLDRIKAFYKAFDKYRAE